jgi:hypothetical protein
MQELEKAISKRAMIGVKSAALKQKHKSLAGEAEAAAKRSLGELQRAIREGDKQVGEEAGRAGRGGDACAWARRVLRAAARWAASGNGARGSTPLWTTTTPNPASWALLAATAGGGH